MARVAGFPWRLSAADAGTGAVIWVPDGVRSSFRLAIVGSAGLAVNWQQRVRRLGAVHGQVRFRLISVQHAFSDNFRDGDLLNGVARGASSSDDQRTIRLPESFHCVLCRTPARAGARCRHVPDWLRGRRDGGRRFHTR